MVKKIKDYVVYKELEIQEKNQVLDTLSQEEIKNIFKKDKRLYLLTMIELWKNKY